MKLLKKCLILIVTAAMLLGFSSCKHAISKEDATARTEAFVSAIGEARYEDAAALMHPSRETSPSDVKMYITSLEDEYGIDFGAGFSIERYTGMKSSAYDSLYEGGYYELTCVAVSGEHSFEFRIEIVKNEYGYGIHNFHFDFSK